MYRYLIQPWLIDMPFQELIFKQYEENYTMNRCYAYIIMNMFLCLEPVETSKHGGDCRDNVD